MGYDRSRDCEHFYQWQRMARGDAKIMSLLTDEQLNCSFFPRLVFSFSPRASPP